jgi:hypothetical protein
MRTKKVKPPPKKFEYILLVLKEYDSIKKKDYYSFKFNTTKEFLIFRYILNIETQIKDNSLTFKILGFKAPTGDLSNYGVAEFIYRLYDFHFQEYSVSIQRKDVDEIKFKLSFQRSKSQPVKLGKIPKNSFIEVKTEL